MKVTLPLGLEVTDGGSDYVRAANDLFNWLNVSTIPTVDPRKRCLGSGDYLIVLVTPDGKKLAGKTKTGGTPIFVQMVEKNDASEATEELPNVLEIEKGVDNPNMFSTVGSPENRYRFLAHVREVLGLEPEPAIGWVRALMKKRGVVFEDSSSDEEDE